MNSNKIKWVCLVEGCDLIIEITDENINNLIELGEFHNIQHSEGYIPLMSDAYLKMKSLARGFHEELHQRDIIIAKLKDRINKLSQILSDDDDN